MPVEIQTASTQAAKTGAEVVAQTEAATHQTPAPRPAGSNYSTEAVDGVTPIYYPGFVPQDEWDWQR